jgi:hypothetical protein
MAWPLLKTSSGFGRFADDQVIDQNRPDLSESGYYLVITWLLPGYYLVIPSVSI